VPRDEAHDRFAHPRVGSVPFDRGTARAFRVRQVGAAPARRIRAS